MKNKQVKFIDLGRIEYQQAWDFQEKTFKTIVDLKIKNRKENTENPTLNYLIFCQHPHVYTLGKSGKIDNLLLNEQQLENKEATFFKINRGGDITYHGPGQLVGYPILDLDNFFTDIHKYLRLLEEAVILTCANYNIEAERIAGLTGVWIDPQNPRKICALGVKSSRWVTMHGFAFNINTNLDYFNNIIPCGIDDKAVTSLEKELGIIIDFEEVSNLLKGHLADLFEMEII
jgi:lipoyl(octanoyl) transferase